MSCIEDVKGSYWTIIQGKNCQWTFHRRVWKRTWRRTYGHFPKKWKWNSRRTAPGPSLDLRCNICILKMFDTICLRILTDRLKFPFQDIFGKLRSYIGLKTEQTSTWLGLVWPSSLAPICTQFGAPSPRLTMIDLFLLPQPWDATQSDCVRCRLRLLFPCQINAV